MSLENNIKDVISKKLEDGTIEKIVSEQLEKGVANALESLFRSYGDVTKIIEEKIKSVMVPYLESYDYSQYITKLDSVLVEVLKNSALENKKLLENFKTLMTNNENIKSIKVTEIFDKWMKYVSENVSTTDLEICYDDYSYQNVEVIFEFIQDEKETWSSMEKARIIFVCEHDEDMNFEINVHRWDFTRDRNWIIDSDKLLNLKSLRHLNELQVLLMNLSQHSITIEIDSKYDTGDVEVEAKPEASFS